MLSVVLHSSLRNLKDMKKFGFYEMLLALLCEKKQMLEVSVIKKVTYVLCQYVIYPHLPYRTN
jgi:hypothetical protein